MKIGISILLVILPLANVVSAGEESIVFKGSQGEVSYIDMERYIRENLPADPTERALVLNRPDLYREMAETLYTLEALATEAENAPDFDRDQALWNAHIMYQRRIIRDYRKSYLQQRMTDVNWEATAREAYQVNKQQYVSSEMVEASHILIKVEEGRSDEDARKLAADLRERALQGEDFGELAKEYSQDPSGTRNGGNLGFFKRGQMVKPFEEVAFAMQEPGALSEVVKTPFGYHVIQYHGRRAPEQMPFESVKDKIIEGVKTQMGNKLWQDKLIALRSASDIAVDDKLLQELQAKYRTQADSK